MIKPKDKYSFAIFAAVLANIPMNILDYIFYTLDINQYHMWHIAASSYFKVKDTGTIPALITGAITDYSAASIIGIAILCLLYFTGTDYFWLKGLSVGAGSWLFAFGIILRRHVSRIDPVDPGTNLYHITEHYLLGLLIACIIVKYGADLLTND